ncbi:MAG: 1-deoxy-D-xylulose 5-phosphate reductoisomerase [Chlamydiae bacterium]|nr:1-deoxy-D-xylulose 5-phosphate reductoisomerase [Chlamydiota bacterium]
MIKKIGILGSTGSIGTKALAIARHLPDQLKVTAIAAKSNIDLLEEQAREFQPEVVAVWEKDKALELQKRLPSIPVLAGAEGMDALAVHECVDTLLVSINGAVAIEPTLKAIEARKAIALASKEVLVSAGKLVVERAKALDVSLVPVDSEHTALFQCLKGEKRADVGRLILTASGGPFREKKASEFASIGIEEALSHPNYTMGAKVTIDSSTLMNKGLEMIEAHHLYEVDVDQIEVVVHPEQYIHSMVEFVDGSIMAQLSEPDMLLPIQYALTYPERSSSALPPFDFQRALTWNFSPADTDRFRCLALAYAAAREGGSMPCFMSAANEQLVSRFLEGEISWLSIGQKLESLMEQHSTIHTLSLEALLAVDSMAREQAIGI